MQRRVVASLLLLATLMVEPALTPGGAEAADDRRVIVVGIDGMDWGLTEQMMAAGELPNFSKLARQGSGGPLGTSVPPLSPVAWSDFITGMDAGGHGIFDFIHRHPDTMAPYLSTSEAVPSGLNMKNLPGRLVVIGTPAEEGGGGKIKLLEAGVFDGVDICLSSHPSSNRTIIPQDIPMDESWSLAMVGFRYIYHGKAAHAAAAPEEGINALNSLIHLFTGIDALRQHLREDTRIHGIITDGGLAPNVVPEFAAANFMLRCRDRNYLSDVIVGKVLKIAEGAALITGASW